MTRPSAVSRNDYVGTGSAGPFSFTFPVQAVADLRVVKRAVASGLETVLAYPADYTTAAVFPAASGSITLTTALATGEVLTIRRGPAITQPTSYRSQGAYFPSMHEDSFDKAVDVDQYLNDALARSIGVPETIDPALLNLRVVPEVGKALVWASSTQLGNSAIDTSGVALPGAGRTVATVTAYLLNNAVFNVLDYAPVGYVAGTTDAVAMFDAAIAAAVAAGQNVVLVPAGDYICDTAKINIPQGITLFAYGTMGEYDGNPYTPGARLRRTTAGVAGEPIVQLNTSSACLGLELRWEKAGGALQGALRFGQTGTFITNARFVGAIRGTRTGDITGATTCYGILFPDAADARFFNDINAYVTECDVSCRLGQMANANRIVLMSREAHIHLELNATAGQTIENDIYLMAFAITVLAPAWGMKLRNAVKNKIRGVYEAYGACFDIDSVTAGDNDIDMTVNEATASYVPDTSSDRRFAPPVNHYGRSSMLLLNSTNGDRDVFGLGNSVRYFKQITGTLPETNKGDGALAAANANVKRIILFGSQFTKAGLNSFHGRLKVFGYGPGDAGMHIVDVEFAYRNTNFTTTAGELNVHRVTNKGGRITGLYFLKGVNAARPFGIAVVGSGSGGATVFDAITVWLELEAVSFQNTRIDMTLLAPQSFATAALDANDVLDGISLLAVADTAV